jgi:hypothetical protein
MKENASYYFCQLIEFARVSAAPLRGTSTHGAALQGQRRLQAALGQQGGLAENGRAVAVGSDGALAKQDHTLANVQDQVQVVRGDDPGVVQAIQ